MSDVKRLDINGASYDIKAVSVVNNGSGGPVKQWSGTFDEYTALVNSSSLQAETYYVVKDTGSLFYGPSGERIGGG